MKRLLMVILAVLFVGTFRLSWADKPAKPSKEATRTYEVVDVACYLTKGAHGAAHKDCCVKCISQGVELALLRDGDLFIPVDEGFHSLRDKFASQAGEMVKVTGKIYSKGGVNYLVIDTGNGSTMMKKTI